jgi:hypothetical protein
MNTHTSDGIVHTEAPEAPQKKSNLALDDFLTIWHVGFAKLNFSPELTQPSRLPIGSVWDDYSTERKRRSYRSQTALVACEPYNLAEACGLASQVRQESDGEH